MFGHIRAVMVFASDPLASARWSGGVLEAEVQVDGAFAFLNVGGVEYGFHPADDERNPRGGSPVVYWSVHDLPAARARLIEDGCTHHRGPLRIDDHRQICQLTDPFGLVFGLDGS